MNKNTVIKAMLNWHKIGKQTEEPKSQNSGIIQ